MKYQHAIKQGRALPTLNKLIWNRVKGEVIHYLKLHTSKQIGKHIITLDGSNHTDLYLLMSREGNPTWSCRIQPFFFNNSYHIGIHTPHPTHDICRIFFNEVIPDYKQFILDIISEVEFHDEAYNCGWYPFRIDGLYYDVLDNHIQNQPIPWAIKVVRGTLSKTFDIPIFHSRTFVTKDGCFILYRMTCPKEWNIVSNHVKMDMIIWETTSAQYANKPPLNIVGWRFLQSQTTNFIQIVIRRF